MQSLGFVIWDEERDEAHRPDHGSGWRARRAPPRIYPTKPRAVAYANDKPVREVFVSDTNA